jgi:hypothetical protein
MKADFAKADGFAVDDKSVTRVEAETAASNIPDGVAWQRSMGHDVKGFEWGGFSATQKVIFMFQAGAVIGMWLCANIELVAHWQDEYHLEQKLALTWLTSFLAVSQPQESESLSVLESYLRILGVKTVYYRWDDWCWD